MPMPDRLAAAIMKKVAPKVEVEVEGDEKHDAPEGLKAATEDIMAALGQDYGSGANAEKGQRQQFEDKRDRLCKALCNFFDMYDGQEDASAESGKDEVED